MSLIDLPTELLALVARHLVDDVGALRAVKYRYVCKALSHEIWHYIIYTAPIHHVFRGLTEGQKVRLLMHHGGEMHANKRGARANEVSRLAESMVNDFRDVNSEEERRLCMLLTCRAMIEGSRRLRNAHWKEIVGDEQHYDYDRDTRDTLDGVPLDSFESVPIKYDPPASATVINQHRLWFFTAICGDRALFKKLVPMGSDVLLGYGPFIPSALHGAIAAGRQNIVEYILNRYFYSFGRSGYTPDMTVRRLTTAFCVAVRQRHFSIAKLIWRFLKPFSKTRQVISTSVFEDVRIGAAQMLCQDTCVDEQHIKFMTYIMSETLEISESEVQADLPRCIMPFDEGNEGLEKIWINASCDFLRNMLSYGTIDKDDPDWYLCFELAMDYHRFDLARIWLDEIDFFEDPSEAGHDALVNYIDGGYLAGVRFLIDMRAVPANIMFEGMAGPLTGHQFAMTYARDPQFTTAERKRYRAIAAYLLQAEKTYRWETSLNYNHCPSRCLVYGVRALFCVDAYWMFERLRDDLSEEEQWEWVKVCDDHATAKNVPAYDSLEEEEEDIWEVLIRALKEWPMDDAYRLYSRIREAKDDELQPLAWYCIREEAEPGSTEYI